MLVAAGVLIVFISLVHSILGEKYLLTRLFRRDNLPKILGSDWFTKQTLRFAWHITSIAWLGFAAILFQLALEGSVNHKTLLMIIAITFAISGLVSFAFSKTKHLSWVVFWAISGLCYWATTYSY